MRETLFNSILAIIRTCDKLIGEDGTVRVYDYPQTAPSGYPYAVLSSGSLESEVLDNMRDVRKYAFNLQIIGEKYGSEGGTSQSEALQAMRATEDAVMTIIDANYFLGRQDIVVRLMPINSNIGVNTDNGARVVLTIGIRADVTVAITS